MSIKEKISRRADANLQISFDVGHSSIGWAALEKTGNKPSDINILGCGSVVYRANDCLASSRRAYRRQRRHIRSTKQRIARIKTLLKQMGVLTEAQLNQPGCAWPWKLAAQILQGGKLLTWSELWDVLRWYAHNRGYDGNRRWSKSADVENETSALDETDLDKILNDASATEDEKDDAKKVIEAKNLMRRHNAHSMAETFCKELGIDPMGQKKSSMKRFKGLNAAFPRKIVESEVRKILQMHVGKLKGVDANFEKSLFSDWRSIPCPDLKLPKRYEGGLLFGQLVPRFDNRIISICPISDQKVPTRNCPEFLNFRWAMQLANIRTGKIIDKELQPLTSEQRKALDKQMRERGYLTPKELKDAVRSLTSCERHNLDTMFMLPDAKEALLLDPVQKLICSDDLQPFWNLLKIGNEETPTRLQKRLRGQWRRGKSFSLAQIRKQLKTLGDTGAFDAELEKQLDTQNTKAKKKDKQTTRAELLQKHFPSRPLKIDGRAAFARHLLKQAYEEVMDGFDPRKNAAEDFKFENGKRLKKEKDGCIFFSEEIRQKQSDREIAEQTNNHLVRHRLLILAGNEKAKPKPKEGLLQHLIKEYADGDKTRIGKITIEVNRDLRDMSGMDSKAKDREMREKLGNIRAVEEYVLDRLPEKYHGRVNGSFLRKARVADDLDWRCPYTGESLQPIHLMTGVVDLDHVIPYAVRPSNSLDSLVATFSTVNRMKKKRTAMQFMKEMNGKPVCFTNEKGQEERIEGMPGLSLLHLKDFKAFIEKLKIRGKGEHEQDKERRLRRKRLLELESYEEKEFLPRDLTQTSQLVRLGAQVLLRALPHLNQSDVVSLPGSVTGTVRKSWNLNACLELACPDVMEEAFDKTGKKVRQAKIKSDIRGITHLHHALDACVLGLASHFIPNSGQVWKLITKRRLDDAEKRMLQVLDVFDFNAENRLELRGLDTKFKEQIRQCLAKRRVVQHQPARMDGLRVEQTTWRVVAEEDNRVVIRQRVRQADGTLPSAKTEKLNPKKLLGLNPTSAGKLTPIKGVMVISDNFGVALGKQLKVIPFHKVWHQIEELRAVNDGKRPNVLRNGHLIDIPRGNYFGRYRVLGIDDKAAGITIKISAPDAVRRIEKPANYKTALLKTLLKDGLTILPTSYTGVDSPCPTTSSA